MRIGRWAAVALALLVWVPFLFLYFRYGREYKPSLPGEYYRDIPAGLPPAIVSYLWTMGDVPHSAVTATIVDLANRGVVRIESAAADDSSASGKDKPTYRLTLDTTKTGGLDQIDSDLLGFLFTMVAGDTTLTIPEMRDYAKANQKEFRGGLAAWHKTVTTRAEQLGFMEKAGQTASGCMVGVAVIVWIVGPILSVVFETVWPLIAGIASGIAVLIASRALKRRTREAADLHAKYHGLRNYMRDFGRMQEKPPTAVVLWEQYLVLAIVFGIADQVIKDMQVAVPEVVNDPAFRSEHVVHARSPAPAWDSARLRQRVRRRRDRRLAEVVGLRRRRRVLRRWWWRRRRHGRRCGLRRGRPALPRRRRDGGGAG